LTNESIFPPFLFGWQWNPYSKCEWTANALSHKSEQCTPSIQHYLLMNIHNRVTKMGANVLCTSIKSISIQNQCNENATNLDAWQHSHYIDALDFWQPLLWLQPLFFSLAFLICISVRKYICVAKYTFTLSDTKSELCASFHTIGSPNSFVSIAETMISFSLIYLIFFSSFLCPLNGFMGLI